MNLEIGSTIGDYQVVAILGAGGMGKVYKVRNVISDRVEAMKVLLPDLANQPDLADRFLREIKVQASLEHPNIAGLHTAVRVENQLVMLMEYVEGVTLDEKLQAGPLPPAEALNYIMQVLSALEYAHGHGVVHRDIKPANMILTPGGVVKLMDFGIARSATDHKLTQTGTTVGSLYYMSPEQIQGVSAPDSRSDLYSIGVTLYELVTGRRPFEGDSQFAIMAAHLKGTPIPPVTVDPRLPQLLNDVILMSVAKEAEARFQTAAALRNALGNVAGSLPPVAGAPAPPTQAAGAPLPTAAPPVAAVPVGQMAQPAPAKSHRGAWMALGAVAAVLAVVGVVALAPWKGTGAATSPTSQPVAAPATQPATTPPAPVAAQPVAQPDPQPQQPAASLPVTTPAAPVSRPANLSVAKPVTPAPRPLTSAPVAPAPQPVPAQQPPTQQPAVQPAPQQQQPTARQPAAPAGPTREELQQVREHLAMLGVRSSGVRTSLDSLQRSQAARGMNMRGDMVEASNLMTTYLEGASAALNAGDVAQSKTFADKAERQLEKLEKFLGR